MKKFIISFFLTLIFLAPLTAQYQQQSNGNNAQFEAGKLLKQFSKQYYIGLGISAGGYIITVAGAYGGEDSIGLLTLGGVTVLAGSLVMIVSHSKIGRAGEQLMISSQSLGFGNQQLNSVGWAFKLRSKEKTAKAF